ncbi:MAG: hypothetical protein A2Z77_06505 [Chloroflexi bacterium RBG_13_51_36]|nr:MAG: hypothetical protein A2Z77_06505 [Chloroflexi bacterium RBG_13_51_36]
MITFEDEFCKPLRIIRVIKWYCSEDAVGLMQEVTEMRKSKSTKVCKHPERLKGKPGECSPEQIKECHGEVLEHPCVKEK